MKKCAYLLSIVVIILVFALPVSAESRADDYISRFNDILPEDFFGIAEDSDSLIESFSLKGILAEITSAVSGEGSAVSAFFLTLVGLLTISSLTLGVEESFAPQIRAAVGIIISLSVFPTVSYALSSVRTSLTELGNFFTALTPITVGMTAIGGGAATSAVQAAGMYTTLALVGQVGREIFLTIASFGLAVASISVLGNRSVVAVGKGIRSLFLWSVGIFTTILTAVFSLQTVIASSADSAAMRGAKYMASGLIPVVGTAVSGALSTLAAGLSYAKALVGGGAIFVIVSLAISPLVMLLLYRLALTVAISLADLVGDDSCSGLFMGFRFSFDMTIAVYVLSVMVYLFQIILFLNVGVALL